jgi:DNA-directed RNA polymerase subunit RPC12/RpoP
MTLEQTQTTTQVVCPHCKKTFAGELLGSAPERRRGAERYRGFKCPHCKLFVPASRTTS